MKKSNDIKKLRDIFRELDNYFGDLGWWPADSSFEVMVGAVLTQNTSWNNVEKSIEALKRRKLMSPGKILNTNNLSLIIRSSGFHAVKAARLKSLCQYLVNNSWHNYALLKKKNIDVLRSELLNINGIGPETCDCILLYALDKPVFVVDNYTRRIMSRHGIVKISDSYDSIQHKIGSNFSKNINKLKQYHAVLVETAKQFCKKTNPSCGKCPLAGMKGKRVSSKKCPV